MASTADQRRDFGEELRRLRLARGLSAVELAQALGVLLDDGDSWSHAAVTAWERGAWAPRKVGIVDALEEILDADAGDLRRRLGYASSNGDGLEARLGVAERDIRGLKSAVKRTDQKVDEILRILRGEG